MNQDDLFAKLRAANWTEADLEMLTYAVKYDRKVPYEDVLELLGHLAQTHEIEVASEALLAMCKFTKFMFEGIQRARFIANQNDEHVDGMVKFYTERVCDATELNISVKAKYSLMKGVKGREMEMKGSVH